MTKLRYENFKSATLCLRRNRLRKNTFWSPYSILWMYSTVKALIVSRKFKLYCGINFGSRKICEMNWNVLRTFVFPKFWIGRQIRIKSNQSVRTNWKCSPNHKLGNPRRAQHVNFPNIAWIFDTHILSAQILYI